MLKQNLFQIMFELDIQIQFQIHYFSLIASSKDLTIVVLVGFRSIIHGLNFDFGNGIDFVLNPGVVLK